MKIQLTKEQSEILYSWISDNYNDMIIDKEFIEEESPGLMDAIESLKEQLK